MNKDEMVETLYKLKESQAVIDNIISTIGLEPESPLVSSYYYLFDKYLDLLDTTPRDEHGYKWLDWFIFENNWGKNKFEVIINDKTIEINSIEDMVDLIFYELDI